MSFLRFLMTSALLLGCLCAPDHALIFHNPAIAAAIANQVIQTSQPSPDPRQLRGD